MDIHRKLEDFVTRYTVEYGICERCMNTPYLVAWDEIDEPRPADDAPYGAWAVFKQKHNDRVNERTEELFEEHKVPIFSFVADCGGDAIMLCADCLQDILLEMQALEAMQKETS